MGFWNRREDHPVLVDGTEAFYLNALLRGIVSSILVIFTPIYVYKMAGIIAVVGYYFVLRLSVLLLAIPCSYLITKLGFRKSVALSMVFYVFNLFFLIGASSYVWLIVPAAVMGGLLIPFYWISRHSAIVQDSKPNKMGRVVGILLTIESVASLLGPFLGGLIVAVWGFGYLYAVALILLVISLWPVFHMPPHNHKNGASLGGLWQFVTNKRYFHQALGLIGMVGKDYGVWIFWPLIMFMEGVKVELVGGLFAIASFFEIGMRYMMGRTFDKLRLGGGWRDEGVFLVFSVLLALLMLWRVNVGSEVGILGVQILSGIVLTVYSGFGLTYFQLGGRRMGSIAYYVYSEIIYSAAVILLLVLTWIGIELGLMKEVIFGFCALWIVLSVVVARESNI